MLVAIISLKGSPGVTTFSVALAARWPAPARALVVEADPSGGDIGTRFSLPSTPGLLSVAAAARRNSDPGLVWQHTQALPGGLPVLAAPPDADRARAALTALVPEPTGVGVLRAVADAPDTVVIADCGRIDQQSPAKTIVRSADVLVLLSRAHADDLAHLASRLREVGSWSPRPVLLLVGEGYSTGDVARELGVAPLGRIPEDRHGAAVLCGRPTGLRWSHGGPSHSALGRVAHIVAASLVRQPERQPAVAHVGSAVPVSPPAPMLRSIPGVPASPMSANGVRVAPFPPSPGLPSVEDTSARGGAAS